MGVPVLGSPHVLGPSGCLPWAPFPSPPRLLRSPFPVRVACLSQSLLHPVSLRAVGGLTKYAESMQQTGVSWELDTV